MVDLSKKPFFLLEEDIDWVEKTIQSMTFEEKVGQLFIQLKGRNDEESIKHVLDEYHQGGLRYPGRMKEVVWEHNQIYQKHSKIPLLIACNCDNGGDGSCRDGTLISTAAGAAAGMDTQTAYDMGYVSGREATALGCNWTFNPCVDIFMNWRNTIVNTRCFGDNTNDVIENSKAYMRGVHESDMLCCCKHFPGDGVEERDQHLVLGVNNLNVEEWNQTYRKVYEAMIDEGVESIMAGHIALPAMSRKMVPGIADKEIMPATLAPELLIDLLREEMGFNGLILTDASNMAGMSCMMKREKAIPYAIASGCDMILFSNDIKEDFDYMVEGIRNGIVTEERLLDALRRILGLKAKLKLHEKQKKNTLLVPKEGLDIIGCEEHKKLAEQAAERTITLVKDTQNNIPLYPSVYRRIKLYYIADPLVLKDSKPDPVLQMIIEELEQVGFQVTLAENFYDLERRYGSVPENKQRMMNFGKIQDLRDSFDAAMVFINVKGYAQENNVRLRWSCGHSNERPWYTTEIPTIGISMNYTTHLYDVPQIHTFINAYEPTRASIHETVQKIIGESSFKGIASETVFCDKWDTRL